MVDQELLAAQELALRQWAEGMSARDVSRALEGFAEEGSWWGLDETRQRKRYVGKAAITAYLTHFVNELCTELTYTIHTIASDGRGDVMMAEWTDVAVMAGGAAYDNQGVLAATFNGGTKILDARSFFDADPVPHSWSASLHEDA
jgi:ketosteroid isomerase-like protein